MGGEGVLYADPPTTPHARPRGDVAATPHAQPRARASPYCCGARVAVAGAVRRRIKISRAARIILSCNSKIPTRRSLSHAPAHAGVQS